MRRKLARAHARQELNRKANEKMDALLREHKAALVARMHTEPGEAGDSAKEDCG